MPTEFGGHTERRFRMPTEFDRHTDWRAMRYDVLVEVRTRAGMADPAGATIEAALPTLGFDEVSGVRVGKAIRLQVEAPDEQTARQRLDELCQTFLANPVIEDFAVTLGSAP